VSQTRALRLLAPLTRRVAVTRSPQHFRKYLGVSLDAWGRAEDRDSGRTKRLVGSSVAALVLVAALLGVGIAFGGQIKKQVFEEETDVKFVPPEPVKPAPPPPPPPPPPPKVTSHSPPPLGAKKDAPPTEMPKNAPQEGDPNKPHAQGPDGEGDPNGVIGGTGKGGGRPAMPVDAGPPQPPPPPPLQVAEVSSPPVPMSKNMPGYPEPARKQGIEAVIVVKFIVTESGGVEDIKLVKGNPMFDEAVLAAVRTWTFQPATLDGKPVRMARMVKIPFRLKAAN
jgi:periplasmic protein TonB